jgi:hypothetical protein
MRDVAAGKWLFDTNFQRVTYSQISDKEIDRSQPELFSAIRVLTISCSSKINTVLYPQRVSPPLKRAWLPIQSGTVIDEGRAASKIPH